MTITYLMKVRSNEPPADVVTARHSGNLDLPTTSNLRDYVVMASAINPKGGVKELTLTVDRSGTVLKTIKHTQDVSPTGEVVPSLSITGTDGAGGIGPQEILITARNDPSLSATATATNFNGQTSSIHVVFNVIPGPPSIIEFSASPDHINVGEAATLTWSTRCGTAVPGCNVNLRGSDGVNFSDPLLWISALPGTSSFSVSPTRSTLTRYTLTVTNSGGVSVSKPLIVQIYNPQTGANLQPFFFRMTGASQVTPCFTVLVWAPDQATATQLAERDNGGFTATAISQADFERGC